MALNFQSQYYVTTAFHFCQVDYPYLNIKASNRLNSPSCCDLNRIFGAQANNKSS